MMKLTQTVKKGGCAAKVAAAELRDILTRVAFPRPQPKLKINGADFDDASVYEITPELCLIETVDFFTPIVDDAYLFGLIAATNALSDIYAMGAKPKTALAILAFPLITIENSIIAKILQGAVDTLQLAGADLAGGHSIDDETLKFGLSVSGFAAPHEIWTNRGARAGDSLILTKGLGTGTLMAGLKAGVYGDAELADAYASMTTLNDIRPLLDANDLAAIHSATDVTGFGLAGHASQMARASKTGFVIHARELPRLNHAEDSLARGHLTKAHRTNREYVADTLSVSTEVSDSDRLIFFDPQTSGGLLLSVDAACAATLVEKLSRVFPKTRHIGEVRAEEAGRLRYES